MNKCKEVIIGYLCHQRSIPGVSVLLAVLFAASCGAFRENRPADHTKSIFKLMSPFSNRYLCKTQENKTDANKTEVKAFR